MNSTSATDKGHVSIRKVSASDTSSIIDILAKRDQKSPQLLNLNKCFNLNEPDYMTIWMSFVDNQPAGITSIYKREQLWGNKVIYGGYWSNLFVDEKYRRLMIYPLLVSTMMRGIKAVGVEIIFCVMRRLTVTEGHLKLGFHKIVEFPVLVKPILPFRLLCNYYKVNKLLVPLAHILDECYLIFKKVFRKNKSNHTVLISAVDAKLVNFNQLADLINKSGNQAIRQLWTGKRLELRLSGTIEGDEYKVMVATEENNCVGIIIYRVGLKDSVKVGVIMDLVSSTNSDINLSLLINAAESCLHLEKVEAILYLDGLGDQVQTQILKSGFRKSNENYQMIVWPKSAADSDPRIKDAREWRFSFLDHDAF